MALEGLLPLGEHRPRRSLRERAGSWILWSALMVLAVVVMRPMRGELEQAHVVLILLLVVLGGSATGERPLGPALACAGFLIIDYYFQPPFDTLTVAKPLDWLVLFSFLATAIVASQLLNAARAAAEREQDRASEIDRIAALGAETLNAPRPEDALAAIAAVVRDATAADRCDIYVLDSTTGLAALAATTAGAGHAVTSVAPVLEASAAADGSRHRLTVRGRDVGVLVLSGGGDGHASSAAERLLNAFAYYAALGVERVRLAREAEHAEALREADRLKDAILAAVSHDLRAPLTTIKALARGIAARGETDAAIIEEQADRLNHVVTDLLDWSRLSVGGTNGRVEVNAAEDLIGAAIRQCEGALRHHSVAASAEGGSRVLLGRFDFVHSLRILTNLLENAAKYAPSGSTIDVAATEDAGRLVIRVSDRGPGVPAAELERIFTPFYRAPQVPPDVGGAGLGLAIARRLAEVQGGSVTYLPREGGGAEFQLALPAAQEEPAT